MSRLPIRLRLTLVFALAMAAVIVAVGAFLYVRLGASLEQQLDESLETRAAALVAIVRADGTPDPQLQGGDEEFSQVIGPDGTVLAATPGLEGAGLLSEAERERARAGRIVIDKEVRPAGEDEAHGARLLAVPTEGERVVVAGGTFEDRDEALDGLLAQLLIGGPIALLLARRLPARGSGVPSGGGHAPTRRRDFLGHVRAALAAPGRAR